MTTFKQLRVVIASPSDVIKEREALDRVIERVNRNTAERLGLILRSVRWETNSYPGFHVGGAPGLIDPILDIKDCDILIGIFWKKFGTPTMKDGKTGTEHEFSQAYEAWKEKGRPHIMLYFSKKPYYPESPEEAAQQFAVLNFKKNVPKQGLHWSYRGLQEFKDYVEDHLSKYIQEIFTRYCPHCGHKLASGTEKFCPECGQKIIPELVSPPGAIGTRHIQEYSVNGGILNLQFSGNVSREVVGTIERTLTLPNHLLNKISNKDIKAKIQESEAAQQQIKTILNDVNKIERNTETEIEKIKAGDVQISKNELSLKEIILKGNEYFYKREYDEAIKWYDTATKIDSQNTDILFNKGYALMKKGKFEEAARCYDEYLKINPNNSIALNNKSYALAKINRSKEALSTINKSLNINPKSAAALDTKGFILCKLDRCEEAIPYYDKALKISPNEVRWNHKGEALAKIGKHQEAIECFDKALEIKTNYKQARDNKSRIISEMSK